MVITRILGTAKNWPMYSGNTGGDVLQMYLKLNPGGDVSDLSPIKQQKDLEQ